ncbi:hypothetical protein [Saccharospirillum mangrovi]|uniref:hypothetical protein n=1 Tax=Saccharospirillum mangrovi TaxID=2161747 RepID=UPI000D34715D|nr:hypothetical protein [Saccharospirillum mangrovi]
MLWMAFVLAGLMVIPPDALRFELIRSVRQPSSSLSQLLMGRLAATLIVAVLTAALVQFWAASNLTGPLMVVFTGVLTATWLWMRFWIRTFIADPNHPPLNARAGTVLLSTLLSATLWIAVFTQAALLVAWLGASPMLFIGVLVWPLLDALLLVWGRGSDRAGRWLVEEGTQKRWGRILGSLLLAVSLWAIWAVLAQG